MSLKYTIKYNNNTEILNVSGNSITLTNGSVSSTMTSTGSRTLHCKDKYAPNKIIIGNKTLNCDKHKMVDDIIIDTLETCPINKSVSPSGSGVINGPSSYDILNKTQEFKFCTAANSSYVFSDWSTNKGTITKVKLTNLLNPSAFTLKSVTVSDGVYSFAYGEGITAMVDQTLDEPIVNHKYYGRCYQKVASTLTAVDDRFEYFGGDAEYAKNIIFTGAKETTADNQWHLHSNIKAFLALEGVNWKMRSFTVGSSALFQRKEHMIIDLTEAFGSGNEPDKEWCDNNIPYFVGEAFVSILSLPAMTSGDMNVTGNFKAYNPGETGPYGGVVVQINGSLYEAVMPDTVEYTWDTSIGARGCSTDTTAYVGMMNTNKIMATSLASTEGTIWYRLKQYRSSTGARDWFVPSEAELTDVKNNCGGSSAISKWFSTYWIWTSIESGAMPEYYIRCWTPIISSFANYNRSEDTHQVAFIRPL